MFNISETESKKMVNEFYFSKDFKEMKPFPESQVYLRHLRNCGYDLYCVTGRQSLARDVTEEWISEYFPNVFRDLILTNSYTPREVKKSEVCKSLAVDMIIDDIYETCMECIDDRIHPIHFIGDPVYPWCTPNEWSEKNWNTTYENILQNTSGIGPSNECTFNISSF